MLIFVPITTPYRLAHLCFVNVNVKGIKCVDLIGSGCSRSIISSAAAKKCDIQVIASRHKVMMMNGEMLFVPIANLFFRCHLFCLLFGENFFQRCEVLLGMDYIKGIGGVEIYGFGTVSIVRMPCISAFF